MRLRFVVSIAVCWVAALVALYIHAAFWALFGMLVVLLVAREVRGWRSG